MAARIGFRILGFRRKQVVAAAGGAGQEEIDSPIAAPEVMLENPARGQPPFERERRVGGEQIGIPAWDFNEHAARIQRQIGRARLEASAPLDRRVHERCRGHG